MILFFFFFSQKLRFEISSFSLLECAALGGGVSNSRYGRCAERRSGAAQTVLTYGVSDSLEIACVHRAGTFFEFTCYRSAFTNIATHLNVTTVVGRHNKRLPTYTHARSNGDWKLFSIVFVDWSGKRGGQLFFIFFLFFSLRPVVFLFRRQRDTRVHRRFFFFFLRTRGPLY